MRWVVAAALLATSLIGSGRVSAHAAPVPAQSKPDPCGFRNAAWAYAQFSANAIVTINQIGNGSNPNGITSADTIFLKQVVRDAILDMGSDFDWPNGWRNLRYYLGRVMGDLTDTLQTWESSTGVQIWNGVATAEADQANAWQTVKSICPGGGKSTTLGVVARFYDWNDARTDPVTVRSPWGLAYNYDCRHDDSSNPQFLLTLRSGDNALHGTLANEVGEQGHGSEVVRQTGKFYFGVQSNCYWHVRVIRTP